MILITSDIQLIFKISHRRSRDIGAVQQFVL